MKKLLFHGGSQGGLGATLQESPASLGSPCPLESPATLSQALPVAPGPPPEGAAEKQSR